MKRAARFKTGSVVFDKRRKTWNYLQWVEGKRKCRVIGTKQEYPTKTSVWQAVEKLRPKEASVNSGPTVSMLIERYRAEKMPRRAMTRQGYNTWLNHYILPKWSDSRLEDLQARPVDLWLQSLPLAPKSKVHIRGLIRALWEFAMWRGDIPIQRDPMELVTIRNASKRVKQTRSLNPQEFQLLIQQLNEPFRTI